MAIFFTQPAIVSKTINSIILILSIFFCHQEKSAAGDYLKGVEAALRGQFSTALHEWQPLAEKGEASPQFQLGWLYQHGFGVEKNYQTAFYWYSRAAIQGYAYAQTALGDMYKSGYGITKNYLLSYMWLRIASTSWDPRAKLKLITLKKQMTSAELKRAKELTLSCKAQKLSECHNLIEF